MGYGYDSATSCDPNRPSSRRAQRSRLISTIPCDLQQQAYCNLPGSSYPWHAVRRFVTENQGLMRRMYGDLRHIAVLKTEIDSNDIELEDIQETANRYSRKAQSRKNKKLHNEYPTNHHRHNNDVLSEPHFRPTSTSTTSTTPTPVTQTTPTSTITTSKNTTDAITTYKPSTIHLNTFKFDELNLDDTVIDTSIDTNSVVTNFTSEITNIKIVKAPNLNSNSSKNEKISTTLKIVGQLNKVEDSTVTSQTEDEGLEVGLGTTEKLVVETTTTFSTPLDDLEIDDDDDDQFIGAESVNIDKFQEADENLGEQSKLQNKPIEATMEGQLYQEVEKKDTNSPIVVRGKGV